MPSKKASLFLTFLKKFLDFLFSSPNHSIDNDSGGDWGHHQERGFTDPVCPFLSMICFRLGLCPGFRVGFCLGLRFQPGGFFLGLLKYPLPAEPSALLQFPGRKLRDCWKKSSGTEKTANRRRRVCVMGNLPGTSFGDIIAKEFPNVKDKGLPLTWFASVL